MGGRCARCMWRFADEMLVDTELFDSTACFPCG